MNVKKLLSGVLCALFLGSGTVVAQNYFKDFPIGAKPGEVVEVAAAEVGGIGPAILVFAVPCICLALGYLLGQALGFGEMPSVGMAALGLLVGFIPAALVNRAMTRKQGPEFVILRHQA